MKLNIECLLGKHDLPRNSIVNLYGAIYEGGYCPRCDRMIQKEFVYNVWGEEINKGSHILLSGINPELVRDLKDKKFVWHDD